MDGEVEVRNPELALAIVERREGELGCNVDHGGVAVSRARASAPAKRLGPGESCESEGKIGEGVGVRLAHGDEERRRRRGDGVSSVNLVRLVGGGGISSARGAKGDIVGTRVQERSASGKDSVEGGRTSG